MNDHELRSMLAELDPVDELPTVPPATRAAVLRAAAEAPPRRRLRWTRPSFLAAAALLVGASGALAAIALQVGGPAPREYGLGSPVSGPGHPVDGTERLLGLRVADPGGGPPWGIRVYRTKRGAGCWQVGRVLDGQLGWLGRDGLLADDGKFHPLPVDGLQCRPLDARGNLFAYQAGSGLANGQTLGKHSCSPFRTTEAHLPPCPAGDLRFVWFGFLGPQARSVSVDGGAAEQVSPADEGAFLRVERVERLDLPSAIPQHRFTATYTGGRTWKVTDVYPLEEAYGAHPEGVDPPGMVRPQRALPSPTRVRAPVRLSTERWGRNDVYVVRFRAPVATRQFGVDYRVLLEAGPRTAGRACDEPMRFGGGKQPGDVRAGEEISVALSPAIALRWNRGWCPGDYRGRVVLHDEAHTVGTFRLRVPE